MFIGVIPSVAGMGGLAGAVAEAGHLMIPMLSTEIWVATACFITWFILYLGTYQTLERILLGMVFFFSVVTLIIAISMQSTPYAISGSQIIEGLSFSFPFEHAALALAVFGFTGISYGEIMAYTYWCLEKGYAQGDAEDIQEIKNWIRTMQTDVWVTIFFITIGTLPFFFLGAGVLNTLPQLQESLATQSFWNVDIISALQNMFSLVLGDWAKWLFIVLAFFILYSTLLSGTAAFTRTISDYLISMGFVYEKENTRKTLIKFIAFLVPFFSGVFYFLLPNPITLLLIAGIFLLIESKSFNNNQIKINQIPKIISISIGSIIGFISGIVGIGGGIFLSPLLFLIKAGYPKHITSSASFFILINSIFGVAGQLTKDRVLDELINYWPLFLIVLIGGQIGSFFNIKFLSNKVLSLLTSLLVIFVAIRMGI